MTIPTSINKFSQNLPQSYRDQFSPAEIAKHAYVASKLETQEVAVGLSLSRFPGLSEICVCAPDSPGLLSAIFSALASMGYDVASGEAYCYQDPNQGKKIALDLFSIIDPQEKVSEEEAQACTELLQEILVGKQQAAPPKLGPIAEKLAETTVRFLESANGSLSVLEIETTDRSGLLWVVSRALHDAGAEIMASRIRTVGGKVVDQFSLENGTGGPIASEQRLAIQVAVISALDELDSKTRKTD